MSFWGVWYHINMDNIFQLCNTLKILWSGCWRYNSSSPRLLGRTQLQCPTAGSQSQLESPRKDSHTQGVQGKPVRNCTNADWKWRQGWCGRQFRTHTSPPGRFWWKSWHDKTSTQVWSLLQKVIPLHRNNMRGCVKLLRNVVDSK